MLPGSIATDSDVVAELLAHCLPRDRGPVDRAAGGAADPRGRVLLRPHELGAALRRARPVRLPPAVPRPARPGRRARGLGAGLGDAGSQRDRRHLRARGRAGRAGGDRRATGRTSLEVPWLRDVEPRLCIFEFAYIARPDSRLYGREVHETRCRMGELLAAAGAGRGRHGDGRARVGGPRGRGLRPGERHPLRTGPGQEPLHRPLVHRARPAASGPTRCGAS